MSLRFEWDPKKAVANWVKHGISFNQAIEAFDDPLAIFTFDREHSYGELREKLIGATDDSGVVLVVFAERGEGAIRIISAREASRQEKAEYAKN